MIAGCARVRKAILLRTSGHRRGPTRRPREMREKRKPQSGALTSGPGADLGHYGSRSRYFLGAGIAWMTISRAPWTFMQRSGPERPGSPRPCSCRSWLPRRRERRAPRRSAGPPRPASVQPRDRAPAAPTLENVDVVSRFGLIGPLLNLLFAYHASHNEKDRGSRGGHVAEWPVTSLTMITGTFATRTPAHQA
jgi:hypothetical protein